MSEQSIDIEKTAAKYDQLMDNQNADIDVKQLLCSVPSAELAKVLAKSKHAANTMDARNEALPILAYPGQVSIFIPLFVLTTEGCQKVKDKTP